MNLMQTKKKIYNSSKFVIKLFWISKIAQNCTFSTDTLKLPIHWAELLSNNNNYRYYTILIFYINLTITQYLHSLG